MNNRRQQLPRRALTVVGAVFTALALLSTALPTQAAPGDLDPTFGNGGKIVTDFGGYEEGRAIVVQNDGKIVVAGYTASSGTSDFALARYNSDGSFDTTFDSDGIVTTDIASDDMAFALALQPDGKLVAAGFAGGLSASDFALVRYNSDGSLDESFGVGGKVTTDYGAEDWVQAIVVQPDGKLVVAGCYRHSTGTDHALARYNSDGTLDTTFDSDGKLLRDFGGTDLVYEIALQTDGKIITAGTARNPVNPPLDPNGALLVRYNPDGTLDTSFDIDGVVFQDMQGALALVVQTDGRIVAAGNDATSIVLTRSNPDGLPDSSFGAAGKVATDFSGWDSGASALVIRGDGKIVAAGVAVDTATRQQIDFILARYNPDGALDTTFGTDGKVTTDFGRQDSVHALAIQADGKVIAVGESLDPDISGADDFILARYLTDDDEPVLDAIAVVGGASVLPAQTAVEVGVNFTWPGAESALSGLWTWGDGTTSAATITSVDSQSSRNATSATAAGATGNTYRATGSHTYATPGLYTVGLTLSDGTASASASFESIVVYRPASLATGAGWFDSPAGAVAANPARTGKAVFAFIATYLRGQSIPSGGVELSLPAANLRFTSSSLDWLVVAGKKAILKGAGRLNGAGGYGFLLSAGDGRPDKFRLKLWDKNNGNAVVYDNQVACSSQADAADPCTALRGGQVAVTSLRASGMNDAAALQAELARLFAEAEHAPADGLSNPVYLPLIGR